VPIGTSGGFLYEDRTVPKGPPGFFIFRKQIMDHSRYDRPAFIRKHLNIIVDRSASAKRRAESRRFLKRLGFVEVKGAIIPAVEVAHGER
jgi:hypothetical protein